MTIRKKSILFIVFIITITSYISAYNSIRKQNSIIEKGLIERGMTLNLALSKAVSRGVAREDLELIEAADSIVQAKDVDLIQVFSTLWEPIESFPDSKLRELPHKEAVRHFASSQNDIYYADNKFYDFYSPIFWGSGEREILIGFTRVVLSTAPMKAAVKRSIYHNLLFALLFVFVGSFLSYFLLGFIIKPIEKINHAVNGIKEGNYSSRVVWDSSDELGWLSETINNMAETIEKQTAELKIQRAEAEKQRDYIQTIINAITDPIIVIDTDYNVIFSNKSSLKFHHNDVFKIEKCYQLSHHQDVPCKNDAHPCPLKNIIKTKKPVSVIHRHHDKTEERFFEIVASPIFNDAGDVVQIIEACRDITERLMFEERERELERKSADMLRMKALGTIAAGVSHHFNNILTPIMGYAELLKTEVAPNHPWYKYIDVIDRSAIRGGEITRELTRYVERETTAHADAVDLKNVINRVLFILKDDFDKSITLMEDIDDDLCRIKGDKEALTEVITELCMNARDAMPQRGVISITAKNISLDAAAAARLFQGREGKYVCITVKDSGSGIADENIQRIFDPFFTTKEVGTGTGLGLPMVYGVIKSHSGYLTVQSEAGKGSIFNIYIPAYSTD